MSLIRQFKAIQDAFIPIERSNSTLMSLVDLTCLHEAATLQDIQNLAENAIANQVAAICVLPQHLVWLPASLAVSCATVANFTTGCEPHKSVLVTLEQIIKSGVVQEIDYVFPYFLYLQGEEKKAMQQCAEVASFCQQEKLSFKIILETGALPSIEYIYQLSKSILQVCYCNFLKTSTGKIAIGATPEAAFAILSAIVDSQAHCGIKVSGGIKTKAQLITYVQLAEWMLKRPVDNHWFRVGTSQLFT